MKCIKFEIIVKTVDVISLKEDEVEIIKYFNSLLNKNNVKIPKILNGCNVTVNHKMF